jgi:hypothetical protein
MEVLKDLFEKQKMKSFNCKKSRWTPKFENNCVKEWKFKKISLKNKRWGASTIRNCDGHSKTTTRWNGSLERYASEAEDEKI